MSTSASRIGLPYNEVLAWFHDGLKEMLQATDELLSRQEQKDGDSIHMSKHGTHHDSGECVEKGKRERRGGIDKGMNIDEAPDATKEGTEFIPCLNPLSSTVLAQATSIKNLPVSPKLARDPCLTSPVGADLVEHSWRNDNSIFKSISKLQRDSLKSGEASLKAIWISERGRTSVYSTRKLASTNLRGSKSDLRNSIHSYSDQAQGCILHPAFRTWQHLEFLALCIIMMESFLTPFQVFDPPRSNFFVSWDWVNAVYWSFRIFVSFRVGFYTAEGLLEFRSKPIALSYLKSWFLIDCCCAVVDWMSVANFNSGHFAILGSVKWLRLVKLVRLLKLSKLIDSFREGKHSKSLFLIINLVASLGRFLCLSHLIACGWYAVGKYYTNSRDSWLKRLAADVTIAERSLGFRYMSSLHWALTQCTPASMEVTPTNTAERFYNVIVVVLGMLSFSSLIASISASVNQLRRVNETEQIQDRTLRVYFRQFDVGDDLAFEILHYIRYARKHHRHYLCEGEVDILKTIPRSLLRDLRVEIYTPIFGAHPFFERINIFNETCFRDFVNFALAQMHVISGSDIFTECEIASHMYFVFKGPVNTRVPDPTGGRQLDSQGWIGEIALWLETSYQARAICSGFCELISVDSDKFGAIASGIPLAHAYAERFHGGIATNCDLYCDMYSGFQADALQIFLEDVECQPIVGDQADIVGI